MYQSYFKNMLEFRCHISIVHHIKGRIRLRISQNLIEQIPRGELPKPRDIFSSLSGIKNVRINRLAALVIVQYDPISIPPQHWEKLIHGNDQEAEKILTTFGISRSNLSK